MPGWYSSCSNPCLTTIDINRASLLTNLQCCQLEFGGTHMSKPRDTAASRASRWLMSLSSCWWWNSSMEISSLVLAANWPCMASTKTLSASMNIDAEDRYRPKGTVAQASTIWWLSAKWDGIWHWQLSSEEAQGCEALWRLVQPRSLRPMTSKGES